MFSQAIHEQETQQAFQRRSPTLLINFKNYDHIVWRLILQYKLYRILMNYASISIFGILNHVILYVFLHHLFKSCVFLIIAEFHKEK